MHWCDANIVIVLGVNRPQLLKQHILRFQLHRIELLVSAEAGLTIKTTQMYNTELVLGWEPAYNRNVGP